ncbi:MFS transporter [Fructilactobacillus myrtifloralis]|uniref:MFS transporter n=1 Tax=Fructilactobacillus myrtifloralis TaxID=2940301 RepID=A0ABY5BR80_9LACO|nr:MFS transporter [Fructilactobacillus myrtifloralis]USS84738.1 MFS transporter [Fructilactobacillus myrtifloralis]
MRKFREWGLAMLLIGGAAGLIMLMQWQKHTVILGYDTFFHFNRIYDAAQQLQTGRFNYFMSNYGYQQSGQMINALYGPYFAYGLGLLLWLTGSWFSFQLVTGTLILVGAGVSAWVLFCRLHVKRSLAILGALIYLGQNFITYWITSAAFLDWGAMILPLAVLMGLGLLDGRPAKISWGLGMVIAILIEMHTLSAVMTCLLLIPFALVGWWRSKTKWRYLGRLGLNALGTLVLTANYLVVFVNVMVHNRLVAPFAVKNLAQGAMHFLSPNWMQADLGVVFIVIISGQIALLLLVRPQRRLNYFLTGIGLFFFYISSNLFPWRLVGRHLPFLNHFLQFPSRFFSFAALLILAGFLMSLTTVLATPKWQWGHGSVYALVGLLAVMTVMLGMRNVKFQADNNWHGQTEPPQVGVYTPVKHRHDYYQPGVTNARLKADFASSDLSKPLLDERRGITDYLPNNSGRANVRHLQTQYQTQIMPRPSRFTKHVDRQGQLHVAWRAPQSAVTTIPVVAYHDTRVRLNGRPLQRGQRADANHFTITEIGAIQVATRSGTNQATVAYHQAAWITAAGLISLGAWFLVLVGGLWLCIRHLLQRCCDWE